MIIVFDCLPVSDLLAKYAHYDSGHWGSSPFRQEKSHLPALFMLKHEWCIEGAIGFRFH